jgi:hypothetical protein
VGRSFFELFFSGKEDQQITLYSVMPGHIIIGAVFEKKGN